MKLVVWKNHFGGQILYRSVAPPIKNGVIAENAEPASTEEAGRDQAPVKRRKIQPAPKTAPTMPKSPTFMSRKKPEIHKKTGEKSKKENLSEFYKNFPKQTVDPKQKVRKNGARFKYNFRFGALFNFKFGAFFKFVLVAQNDGCATI